MRQKIWESWRCRVIGEVKWLLLSALTTMQWLWWRSCRGRRQRGAGPGKGASAAPLYHHRVRELIAKLITPCPSMTARAMRFLGRVSQFLHTGCLYKLSTINLVWWPLKCTKSNFNPVHVFLHFGTFCFVVLQLILASKLSELEQFENFAANNQFRKQKRFKMTPKSIWYHCQAMKNVFVGGVMLSWQ